jgi:hypothetical protein
MGCRRRAGQHGAAARHGYGSAVGAAAAELAARSGVDDVVLFADVANPVSNAT